MNHVDGCDSAFPTSCEKWLGAWPAHSWGRDFPASALVSLERATSLNDPAHGSGDSVAKMSSDAWASHLPIFEWTASVSIWRAPSGRMNPRPRVSSVCNPNANT